MNAQRFSRVGRFRLIAAMLDRPGALIVDDDGVRIEPLSGGERAVERWAWADIRRAGLEEIVAEDVVPEVQLVLVRQDGEARRIKLADYGRPQDIVAALRRHIDLDPQPWQTLGQEQQIGSGMLYVAGAILLFSIVAPLAAAFLRFDEDGRWRSFVVLLVVAALLLVMGSFFRRARPPVVETEGMRFWQSGTIRVARWHTLAWEDILDIQPERWGGFFLFGVGLAFFATPATDAALSNLPAEQAGAGAGIFKMASSIGVAIGVAVAAGVYTSISTGEPLDWLMRSAFVGRQDNVAFRQGALLANGTCLLFALSSFLLAMRRLPKQPKAAS